MDSLLFKTGRSRRGPAEVEEVIKPSHFLGDVAEDNKAVGLGAFLLLLTLEWGLRDLVGQVLSLGGALHDLEEPQPGGAVDDIHLLTTVDPSLEGPLTILISDGDHFADDTVGRDEAAAAAVVATFSAPSSAVAEDQLEAIHLFRRNHSGCPLLAAAHQDGEVPVLLDVSSRGAVATGPPLRRFDETLLDGAVQHRPLLLDCGPAVDAFLRELHHQGAEVDRSDSVADLLLTVLDEKVT